MMPVVNVDIVQTSDFEIKPGYKGISTFYRLYKKILGK